LQAELEAMRLIIGATHQEQQHC